MWRVISFCLVVVGLMNSGMTAVVNLSSIGNSGGYGIIKRNDYGEWVKLGAQDFKEASENGVDGVFVPYQMSTKISSTGIQFSFPPNLLSSDSPINSQRNHGRTSGKKPGDSGARRKGVEGCGEGAGLEGRAEGGLADLHR